MLEGLSPSQIKNELDQFVVGQDDAKRAVAVALRNRLRRIAVGDDPIRNEIHPRNIIMIGPTGVGKTEIARRLARLANAPFLKVEATKYTEVGYVGRDVESMIRDLLNVSMKLVRQEEEQRVRDLAEKAAENRILDLLVENDADTADVRELFRRKLQAGSLEDREVEIKSKSAPAAPVQMVAVPGMEELEGQLQNLFGDMFRKKNGNRRLKIADARKVIIEEETEVLLDHEKIREEAVSRAEESGIVFIDEIDKIASRQGGHSGEVSREGVQRDILPLVEGTTVHTRYGNIRTDHILFIAAGAFHTAKVSDLIPELQGRFPVRVELSSLSRDNYLTILTAPRNALTRQYQALLSTEGIALDFTRDGLAEIADIAWELNTRNENIGARRLHTIMEQLIREISYEPEKYSGTEVKIDREFVRTALSPVLSNEDLSRYVL